MTRARQESPTGKIFDNILFWRKCSAIKRTKISRRCRCWRWRSASTCKSRESAPRAGVVAKPGRYGNERS